MSYRRGKWREEEQTAEEVEAVLALKKVTLLSLSVVSLSRRGGAELYCNCAGEVRMIAFYCPSSPQVSARKVLCVLSAETDGERRSLAFSPGGVRFKPERWLR